MKITKIPAVICGLCKSYKVRSVGWNIIEGHFCDDCHNFYNKRTNANLKVIRIRNKNMGTIFLSDLVFEK